MDEERSTDDAIKSNRVDDSEPLKPRTEKSNKKQKKHITISLPRKLFFLTVLLILVGLLAGGVVYDINRPKDYLPYPISKSTADELGFDIYYPNSKKLPAGYTLNMNSFSASSEALLYTVSGPKHVTLIFTDQMKPSAKSLYDFYSSHIPIHSTDSTPVGLATIGAINNESIASLPTNTNAWLLITAPSNYSKTDLNPILQSIEIAK